MPVTGYTINVPKNEIIDPNMTIDQAFQFCISCGVLVPDNQKVTPESLQQALTQRLTGDARQPVVTRPSEGPDVAEDATGEPGVSDAVIRIATRASRLALWQARHVAGLLESAEPGVVVELVEVRPRGTVTVSRGWMRWAGPECSPGSPGCGA
ncbi:MAG: hypothetical protein CM1200mP2_25820 [Planctomycetaceae bacterium]|nr:MAG: hypothetical protein CM1200mP2_25820 [Planctomycetaceae bacterium]